MKDSKYGTNVYSGLIVVLGTLCTILLIFGVSYGLTALATWAICSCFGWPWSWTMALGIWFLAMFLKWMHKYITSHGKKE